MNKTLDFGEPTFKDLGLPKRMWHIQLDGSYWIDSEKVVAYHNDPRDLPSNMFCKIRDRLESEIEDAWAAPWKEMTSSERGAIDQAYVDLEDYIEDCHDLWDEVVDGALAEIRRHEAEKSGGGLFILACVALLGLIVFFLFA